jgi:hypothetical protein
VTNVGTRTPLGTAAAVAAVVDDDDGVESSVVRRGAAGVSNTVLGYVYNNILAFINTRTRESTKQSQVLLPFWQVAMLMIQLQVDDDQLHMLHIV